MNAEMVDRYVLSLTFVCEVGLSGSRKEKEFYLNEKDTVVAIKNRERYVNLLIRQTL
ncbi:hypothetical protein T459_15645 [Capsicum annuum]|uniref:Uncharacterized protein n=1 Tax=Capsicum annuum TaxID=4072 RepID=A0A2G2Z6H3_CAPAN|nr:hypothetical protein T459_15645 [Capsicum annuum]